MHVVAVLENELGIKAVKEMMPMQPGDVMETFADIDDLVRDVGIAPQTSIEDGIRAFATWYRDHYGLTTKV
jgi:UDP-glucuronate 4-epimerase